MNARLLVPAVFLVALACGGEDPSNEAARPVESAPTALVPESGPAAAEDSASSATLRSIDHGEALLVDVLREGTGRAVRATSSIALHYEGRVEDADEPFVRTRDRLRPERFELDPASTQRPIEGLVRALVGLKQGTRVRIHVPGHLAYGLEGAPSAGIEAHADLVFEVEVVEVL